MSLLDVPEEVLIIIIKHLDIKSLHNLYNCCSYTRNVLKMNRVVTTWNIALSPLPIKFLESHFYKDVAHNLQDMNLCFVPDIRKTMLVRALKHTKNLKTLDVSYTDIDLDDFIHVYQVCPSIKNITMNLTIRNEFQINSLDSYQRVFKNMENVHFAGTTEFIVHSNLAFHILKESNINQLKLCIVKEDDSVVPTAVRLPPISELLNFKEMFVYFMKLDHTRRMCKTFQDMSESIFEKVYMFYGKMGAVELFAGPIFKNFFPKNFDFTISSFDDFHFDGDCGRNLLVMVFNKKSVKFDDTFFSNLYKKLKSHIAYDFLLDRNSPAPTNFEWYSSYLRNQTELKPTDTVHCFKRRRIANPGYSLDFDIVFRNHDKVNLNIHFPENYVNSVSLSASYDYLKKLTTLSVSGVVRYALDFFNMLFECCPALVTLDVTAPYISSCASAISRSISLSKVLKNFRLIDRKIDFKIMFLSLAQCQTLENIHILDTYDVKLPSPVILFKSCKNLYNISIMGNMSNSALHRTRSMFNHINKSLRRSRIKINISSDVRPEYYDPSMKVFRAFPISPDHCFI